MEKVGETLISLSKVLNSLREHVERGTYRTFLTESTTAVLKNGRRQKLVLSGDYLLDVSGSTKNAS